MVAVGCAYGSGHEFEHAPAGDVADHGWPITLAGVRHVKGLGCHSPARIGYHLGGACPRFTATVGIDDAATANAEAVVAIIQFMSSC